MTRVRVSVEENFGNYNDPNGEEAQWGPYVSSIIIDKPFHLIEPHDFFGIGFPLEHQRFEDVVYDDRYLMFDLWQDLDQKHHEEGDYCRYNFLVTEEEEN